MRIDWKSFAFGAGAIIALGFLLRAAS